MDSIKEFLKYYIGCEVHSDQGTMTYRLWHISNDYRQILFKDKHGNEMWLPPGKWKPCLRKLSSITEEEAIELARLVAVSDEFINVKAIRMADGDLIVQWKYDSYNATGEKVWSAEQFHYLLSRGFWLFGDEAFDKGLIIEKQW